MIDLNDRLIKVEMHIEKSNESLDRIENKLEILDEKIDNIFPKCAVHDTKFNSISGQLKGMWAFILLIFSAIIGYVFKITPK